MKGAFRKGISNEIREKVSKEKLKDRDDDCCDNPSIRSQWNYLGTTLQRGSAHCSECKTSWLYDLELKKFVVVK